MSEAILSTYPHLGLVPWKFTNPPPLWWKDEELLEKLLREWNAIDIVDSTPSDKTYSVTDQDFLDLVKGTFVLFQSSCCLTCIALPPDKAILVAYGSVADVLMLLFREANWEPWRFTHSLPTRWWDSKENQARFLVWLLSRHSNLSRGLIRQHGGMCKEVPHCMLYSSLLRRVPF